MTPHGFIEDFPKAIEKYKTEHKDKWLSILGTTDFDLIEEGDMEEDRMIFDSEASHDVD
jgi:hypothetical protein